MSAQALALAAIRPAIPADVDALHCVEHRAFQCDRISRRSFSRLIRSASTGVLVCERDGHPVGYALVLFRSNSQIARLYSLAVLPDFGGEGHGSALLRAAEDLAAGKGASEMRLEVRADNARAMRLYRKLGYRFVGTKLRYYEDGAAAHCLVKSIRNVETARSLSNVSRSGNFDSARV